MADLLLDAETTREITRELDAIDAIANSNGDSPYERGMRCATGHLRDWLHERTMAQLKIDIVVDEDAQ